MMQNRVYTTNRFNTTISMVFTRIGYIINQTSKKQLRSGLKEFDEGDSREGKSSEPTRLRLPLLLSPLEDNVIFPCHFVLPSKTDHRVNPSFPKPL